MTGQTVECSCTFKYNRVTKDIKLILPKEEFSEALLCAQAIQLIGFPEGTEPSDLTLEFQVKQEKTKLDQTSLQNAAASGSLMIVISTMRRAFSSWTFDEFTAHFKLTASNYRDLTRFTLTPGDFPDGFPGGDSESYINNTLNEVLKIYTLCPSALAGIESERSLFVFELLKQITYLFSGKLQLRVQKAISGSLGSGPVDYVIEHDNAIVMIAEARNENLNQGVAQNVIQLDSVGKQSIPRQSIPPEELTQYSWSE